MKTILIDGYNLALERGTGVATYARNLSYAVRDMGHDVSVLYGRRASSPRDKLLREISFFDGKPEDKTSTLDTIMKVKAGLCAPLGYRAEQVSITGTVVSRTFDHTMPYFNSIFNVSDLFSSSRFGFMMYGKMSQVTLPQAPDLAHWTYPLPVRARRAPNIYTMHDLVPLKLPYTTLDNKRYYLKLMRSLARSADHIVTVSENSKKDIVDILGISPDRVSNTYQAVNIPAELRDKSDEQVAREVEGLAGVGFKEYFLFWGAIEPKKNIGRMIEAYLASRLNTPLVIVGARAWKSKQETRLLDEPGGGVQRIEGRSGKGIIRLSYVPSALLASLVRGAKAALFPSLYEGFGLPALEAMLLGTPVICSNTASLPEVVGDAALTVDPYDTAALAAAIRRIDSDEGLRSELVRRGHAQAARYTPEAYCERLSAVYGKFV